jgi:hypothetical protein
MSNFFRLRFLGDCSVGDDTSASALQFTPLNSLALATLARHTFHRSPKLIDLNNWFVQTCVSWYGKNSKVKRFKGKINNYRLNENWTTIPNSNCKTIVQTYLLNSISSNLSPQPACHTLHTTPTHHQLQTPAHS